MTTTTELAWMQSRMNALGATWNKASNHPFYGYAFGQGSVTSILILTFKYSSEQYAPTTHTEERRE